MANNTWLKQNWLALCIIGAILALGVAWGVTTNQQGTNTLEIEKKLDREIFQMYAQQQAEVSNDIKTTLKEQRADMKEILKRLPK